MRSRINPRTKIKVLAGGNIAISKPEIDLLSGGDWFVEAIGKYGINERGEPLRINKLLLEHARLIGDLRFSMVATSGAAQVFKSLNNWQLTAALLTIAQRDFMWVYPQATMIAALVPTQFKPIVQGWEEALGLERKSAPTDSKSQKIHQSALGTGRFVAASNPSATRKQTEGMAAAGVGGVAASTDVLFLEEASQVPAALLEPFDRRLLQSRIPTTPKRKLGTPGSGGGIERDIKSAQWDFYPHTECLGCHEVSALSPLGWLLTDNGDGQYFSEAGTPHRDRDKSNWHHKDPHNPVDSAYFGCPNCGCEIDAQQRLNGSWFQCLKSGERLSDVLDNIPPGAPLLPLTAGITLSPLIRDADQNEASRIIDKGLKTGNAIDWQQQEIGIPTTLSNNGISIEMVRFAVNAPPAYGLWDYDFWGLDQGTTEHWVVRIRYRLPDDLDLEPIDVYRYAHREVTCIQSCTESELSGIVSGADGGAIDNEPGRDWAAQVCRDYPNTIAFDQRGGRELAGKVHKAGLVQSGGRNLDVILVDTHQMQSYILNIFASKKSLISLPDWINPDDLSPNSACRHLTTSARDPHTGRWTRPLDRKDDLLKAFMGAELRFFLEVNSGSINSGGFDRIG